MTGGDAAAPVRLADPRRRGEPARLAEPLALPGRGHADRAVEQVRLAAFFAKLAVKERAPPRLHVRPLVAELFLTENCNLRCVVVQLLAGDDSSRADNCGVVRRARPVARPSLHQGQLHRRRAVHASRRTDLLAYATRVGIPHLHLNTNGILLDQRRRIDVLRAGVRSFNISVDGPDAAMHDAIRGKGGAFATTIEHLSALVGDVSRGASSSGSTSRSARQHRPPPGDGPPRPAPRCLVVSQPGHRHDVPLPRRQGSPSQRDRPRRGRPAPSASSTPCGGPTPRSCPAPRICGTCAAISPSGSRPSCRAPSRS